MDVFLNIDVEHRVVFKPRVENEVENNMENVEGNAFLPCHAFLVVFSRVFFSRQQTRQNLSIFMKQRETTSAFSRIVLVVLSVSLLSLFRGVIVLVFYNVEKEIFSELRAERLKGANLKPSKDTRMNA